MNNRLFFLLMMASAGVANAFAADSVYCSQTVTLRGGWNAFYLTVSPEETADEVFGKWPVERVGWYDSAAFLETKQYSSEGSSEGTQASGYKVWRRGDEVLSTLKRLSGNGVYTCFVTNNSTFTAGFYGVPVAPRITWHPSSTNEPMNMIGFSLASGEKTTVSEYFDGLDVGNVSYLKFYSVGGGDPSKISLGPVSGITEFSNGEVVVMTASKVSDWSGVLNVTPMNGIDFGLYGQQARLAVRNDGSVAREVTLKLLATEVKPLAGQPVEAPTGLYFRNSDGAITNEAWKTASVGTVLVRNLAAGETWELTLAIDRTKFVGKEGTVYGVVAEFTESGASHMRAAVPIMVTDGGAQGQGAWPQGLWVAAAELDTVTHIGETANYGGQETHEVPSGGKMTVRLPVYVDDDGKLWLLQRYVYGYDTNGVMQIASGAVELNAAEVPPAGRRRVSSPFLPTDQPEISTTNGTFGAAAVFEFSVGENSKVNPMRHAQHPRHDGLTADYSGAAPSGDDFNNYVSKVKPELFSIKNRIQFKWDETTGKAWDPEEKVGGRLTWEFEGIRHGEGEQDGTLRASGKFVMKRVTSSAVRMKQR